MTKVNKDSKEERDYKITAWGIITTVIIIALWVGTYFLLKDLEKDDRGTLGDMFGTVNALFSGLALGGIIFTILLQRKELKYQRDELRQTRLEFETQNETLSLQRFENTFFNLVSLHHQIVNSMDMDGKVAKPLPDRTLSTGNEYETKILQGRDVFKESYSHLKKCLNYPEDAALNSGYTAAYTLVQTDFGHYFRNLYRIIKLVDNTEFYNPTEHENHEELNFKKRYEYTSIIRAQLSDFELLWLFYNCITDNGKEKFKPLIEKYTLFKNLPDVWLVFPELKEKYNSTAFDKQIELG